MNRAGRLMAYLAEHPNRIVYLDKVARALDLDPKAVRVAINNLRRDKADVFPIQTVIRGQAWKHVPGAQRPEGQADSSEQTMSNVKAIVQAIDTGTAAANTYVEIARSIDGTPLLEGPDGLVYRATAI